MTIRMVGVAHNQMSAEEIEIIKGQTPSHEYGQHANNALPTTTEKYEWILIYGTEIPEHVKCEEIPILSLKYVGGIQKEMNINEKEMQTVAQIFWQSLRPLVDKGGMHNKRINASGVFTNGLGITQKYISKEFCRKTWSTILILLQPTELYVSHMSGKQKKKTSHSKKISRKACKEAGYKVHPTNHGGMIDFKKNNLGIHWFVSIFFFFFSFFLFHKYI